MATIGLCMIVKDEQQVIERCLASARPIVDSWLIVDTGSSDSTMEIVARSLEGLPGRLVQRPWVNFGHNRTELLGLASGIADYLLLLDADMELVVDEAFDKNLTGDGYLLRYLGGLDYAQLLLVRDSLGWRYVGATHEYITTDRRYSVTELPTLTIRHHADGSNRANKFQRDIEMLSAELEQNPNDARTTFYLAQSLRDAGELEAALELYQQRAGMGGWGEEAWCAAYEAGKLLVRARRIDEAIRAFLAACEMRPQRAEPLYWLARLHRRTGRNHLAKLFARAGAELGYPADQLFIEREVYEFSIRDELSLASYYTGDFLQSERICEELLTDGTCPPQERQRVRQNLQFASSHTKDMVFGLGTGRCGTLTLAALLDSQPGVQATHECQLLPWRCRPRAINDLLQSLQHREANVVGDVAFYYLNYVEHILGVTRRAKFICLRRDREGTVRSFDAWTGEKNHWTSRSCPHWTDDSIADPFDDCFPKYNAKKVEAIGMYWDHYYAVAESLAGDFPESFRIFPLEALSSENGQTELLQFAGLDTANMRIDTGLHLNALQTL